MDSGHTYYFSKDIKSNVYDYKLMTKTTNNSLADNVNTSNTKTAVIVVTHLTKAIRRGKNPVTIYAFVYCK